MLPSQPPSLHFQSPPGSRGNDGTLPEAYDPLWRTYKNLTPAQILAFQSFPEDLLNYVRTRRWLAELTGITIQLGGLPVRLKTDGDAYRNVGNLRQVFDDGLVDTAQFVDLDGNVHTVDAAGVTAIHQAMLLFMYNLYDTAGTLLKGVNDGSVTTRKQIDAAYAPHAPNSPSALQPSKT